MNDKYKIVLKRIEEWQSAAEAVYLGELIIASSCNLDEKTIRIAKQLEVICELKKAITEFKDQYIL